MKSLVSVQEWFSKTVVSSVNKTTNPNDKDEIIAWFVKAKMILANKDTSKPEKLKEIYSSVEASTLVKMLFRSIGETLKNYKSSNLPLPVKVALPVAITTLAVVGNQGIGLAAFGSAIGMPVVLVLFIGVAGITSIIDGLVSSGKSGEVSSLLSAIAFGEVIRRKDKCLREALKQDLVIVKRFNTPEENELIEFLREMDPFDFERHVMSFLPGKTGVSPASNDYGFDGWSEYEGRLILVQCKRYSEKNKVGRPDVQRFKGAIGDKRGDFGLIVTSGYFSNQAIECANLDSSVGLVDIDTLLMWHKKGSANLNPWVC